MAQRQKRLTKRERKELAPGRQQPHNHGDQHIHCIACGKHLDPEGFDKTPPTALFIQCEHGSHFPSCVGCEVESRFRIAEHDKTNQPVKTTQAWH